MGALVGLDETLAGPGPARRSGTGRCKIMWGRLGYPAARLHETAKAVVEHHDGCCAD